MFFATMGELHDDAKHRQFIFASQSKNTIYEVYQVLKMTSFLGGFSMEVFSDSWLCSSVFLGIKKINFFFIC